ncbi:hypothetical protein LJC48_07055 [Desulfovibrio sp. OttesenSCG-928-C06]|nr:hypothetical protein [Desulfovibrio sp. OttesenSCG-928-C06]
MCKKIYAALVAAFLITLVFGAHTALAAERSDITLSNNLDEPIINVKILYDTPYDETRPSKSEVVILPERSYRLGIQGVTYPTQIILYLPTTSYEFPDLSAIGPEKTMHLEVAYENGVPYLVMADEPEKKARGIERKLFFPDSGDYAVDRDFLTDCKTIFDVRDLLNETAQEAGGDDGMEIQGRMQAMEAFDGVQTLYFPVAWTSDYAGYASVIFEGPDGAADNLVINVYVPLINDTPAKTIDDLMSDLRVDGYRPARFEYRLANESKDIEFLEGDGDKYDDQDAIQEILDAAIAEDDLMEAGVLWVQEDAFEKMKETDSRPEAPVVFVRVTQNLFQAKFIPLNER